MIEKMIDHRKQPTITDIDWLVPKDHLLRKIDRVVNFNEIYDMVEHLYCHDNGRPACDPVVLVKMALIQHIFGIRSMRQTVKECEVNVAYRWFLHFGLETPIPHFATVSYAFATRFPSELFERIFSWVLEAVVNKGFIDAKTVFIDATHVKASANKHKRRKELAQKTARVYDEKLREEVCADRESHGKKPLKDKDDDDSDANMKSTTVSTTDPDAGVFRKGEHKTDFAYLAHVACDKHNFVLECEVTAGNVHDSTVYDKVYEGVTKRFEEIEIVAVDAGYKTPWICKKTIDDGRIISTPYKRPATKKGFFKSYEYVYDEYYDCVICPNNQILKYSTTNRDGYREYKSDKEICKSCPHIHKCTHSKNHQKIVTRHIWQEYIEVAEDIRHSKVGKESYKMRSQTIERVFADAKEKHSMRYTLHRGLGKVSDWIKFKFAAMNLKKLAMWAW